MSGRTYPEVLLQNGFGRTPLGSPDASPATQFQKAGIDPIIYLLDAAPNREPTGADEYLLAGEQGLALQEIEVATGTDTDLDPWSAAALARARSLLNDGEMWDV